MGPKPSKTIVQVSSKNSAQHQSLAMTTVDMERRGSSGRQRHHSNRSAVSLDPTKRGGSSVILKRTSSTPSTNKPFDRTPSRAGVAAAAGGAMGSSRSMTSVRTRLTIISRSEYHQDLKRSLATGLNANLVLSTFVVIFGSSFLFGYNIGVLNQPTQLIKDFYRDVFTKRYGNESVTESTVTVTWSLTTALFIPGGMLGAFLGGFLADSLGRKRTLLLSHVFVFSGAALSTACVAAEAPELLMIGRILVGINSGFANCIAPMFLSEVAPFNYRGAFGTLHQLFVTIGIFLSSVFGLKQLLGRASLWPYLILIEVFPALVSLAIVPFLPDTPRFLLLVQKDRDRASEALRFYRKTDDVDTDMEEMDTEHQAASSKDGDQHHSFTWKHLFLSADLRRPLFVACFLQIIQQFSGINAVFFYSKSIFESAKVRHDHIPYAIIGTNAVNVFMTVIAVPLMDLAGRRPLLLIPMGVMIVDLILMTICRVLQANDPSIAGIAYVTIACVIVYVIAFAVGLGPIPMMIGAELFRQGPRPKAMAAVSVVNWVGTFTIAMAFESIQAAAGDYTFIIFIILLSAFLVFTYFFVPETKNKTFEEIAHQFSPGDHLEVEELEEFPDLADDVIADGEGLENEDNRLVTLNFDEDVGKTEQQ